MITYVLLYSTPVSSILQRVRYAVSDVRILGKKGPHYNGIALYMDTLIWFIYLLASSAVIDQGLEFHYGLRTHSR